MRVALVHDWLTAMRGGEKCLEVFCDLFPDAELFTLVHRCGAVSPAIERHPIRTSFLQRLPRSDRWYPYYLPLMPAAIEALDLEGFDLVLSSSHCVAKGAIPSPAALHLSYVHAPMRYAWDLRALYLAASGPATRWLAPLVLNRLRTWDCAVTGRVDRIAANSRFVARRIARYYGREATVIHPPVDTAFFSPPADLPRGEFFLVVGALVPYKGVDLAVRAFNELRLPLKVVGDGPLLRRLRRLAGPTVEFTGWLPGERLREYYGACRAVVFPSVEDFGIVPLEANAMGRPVIALGRGGALETVVPLNAPRGQADRPQATGIFFHERSAESLAAAVRWFAERERRFSPDALRGHALRYDRRVFRERAARWIDRALAEARPGARRPGRRLDSRPSRF